MFVNGEKFLSGLVFTEFGAGFIFVNSTIQEFNSLSGPGFTETNPGYGIQQVIFFLLSSNTPPYHTKKEDHLNLTPSGERKRESQNPD